MIAWLRGKIILKKSTSHPPAGFIILDVGGIGYKIFLSEKTLDKIPKIGEILKVFTSLYLREETAEIYGFLTFEEVELFETLNEISGIGPKTAMVLASFGSLEKLKKAMEIQEEKFYQEIKGIGKKKMQKIILELTGKIKDSNPPTTRTPPPAEGDREVFDALISLGFSPQTARGALERIPKEIEGTEKRIEEALKILGRR